METNSRITFLKKIKVLSNIGSTEKVNCFFLYKLLFHAFNYLYVFGGWIFVLNFYYIVFKIGAGYTAPILTFITWVVINVIVVYLLPCKYEDEMSD